MAKGKEKHEERQAALELLGKDLARRARSRCEVCEASGVPLRAYEVPPPPAEPEMDRCALICHSCEKALENTRLELKDGEWRCLGNTLWSDVPAVQVAVVRLLRRLAPRTDWARELLEDALLDEETLAWADRT
jgi:protein PhnA